MSGTLRWLPVAACIAGMGWTSTATFAATPVDRGVGRTVSATFQPSIVPGHAAEPVGVSSCDAPGCDVGVPTPGTAACLPIWGNFEYLLWWNQEAHLPALVTTSTTGTSRDNAAVLGLDSTTVLFGGDDQADNDSRSGARITLGLWLDHGQATGVFGRWFALGESEFQFQAESDGSNILGRPFFNALTNEPDALLLGFPDEIAGNVQARYANETSGYQILMRRLFRAECNYRIDFVFGYRQLAVDEALRVDNLLEFTDPAGATFGTRIDQFDRFAIENEFHGGEIGLMGHSVDGRFTMDFLATVALGSMREHAELSGSTVTTPANGDSFTANGGLLTQNSNLGRFDDDKFSVIPEFTVNLGYFATPRLDLSVGYTFLYVNHVMRVPDVIDPRVNLNQQTGVIGGPDVPEFRFRDAGYWVQGLNFAMNLRY